MRCGKKVLIKSSLLKRILSYYIIVLLILTLFPIISEINSADSWPDLIGHWDFDGGGGDITLDKSGYNNHGAVYGASFSEDTPDGSDYSLYFDGDGDYVDVHVEDVAEYKFNNQPLSFSVWVKILDNPSDLEYNFISLGDNNPPSDKFPHIGLTKDVDEGGFNYGSIYYEIDHEAGLGDEDIAFSDYVDYYGEWIFLVGVIDWENDKLKLYIDGEEQSFDDTNLQNFDLEWPEVQTLHLHFGKACGEEYGEFGYHYGYLDDVRIYGVALTE